MNIFSIILKTYFIGENSEPTRKILILDSLIIFLNISNYYTILNYFFLTSQRSLNTLILFLINIIYLIYRFRGKIQFLNSDYLFIIYLIICFFNIIFSIISHTLILGFIPFILLNVTFYFLLISIFSEYIKYFSFSKSVSLIIRGYLWLAVINIVSVCLMHLSIKVFQINPLINEITNKYDLFASNVEKFDSTYFFPYLLSVVLWGGDDIRIPFFQSDGMITGFFHEPHSLMFTITPAFFLIIDKLKSGIRKILFFIIFIFVVLSSSSTTNILALLICLFVYLFLKYRNRVLIPVMISIALIFLFTLLDEGLYTFIALKLVSGSAEYSMSTISFAFTPKTLIGTNFFDLSFWSQGNSNYDVGYIIFFLNVLFLLIFIYKITKLNISRIPEYRLIGLCVLYFFLHSMKQAMVTFSISILIFFIFLVNIYLAKDKIDAAHVYGEN